MYICTLFVFCKKYAQQPQNYHEVSNIAEEQCDPLISLKIFQLAFAFLTKLYLSKFSDNGTIYSIFFVQKKTSYFSFFEAETWSRCTQKVHFYVLVNHYSFYTETELLCL